MPDASLLSPAEVAWIDDYRRGVAAHIGPLLKETGRAWLHRHPRHFCLKQQPRELS